MKLQHVDFQGITFDLWNTLLVSEPGGVEVRQSPYDVSPSSADNVSTTMSSAVAHPILPPRTQGPGYIVRG